jgi:outer membrane protein
MRNVIIAAAVALAVAVPRPSRAAEQKIGYVNLQQAVNEVEEGKAARAALKKEFDQKQKMLDDKQAEFKKLTEDFEKQSVVMSEDVKREKQADFQRRYVELQGLFGQMQKELSDRERDMMKGIFDKMEVIIKEIADAEGFNFVFEQQNAGLIVAPPANNLTSELVRKYNTRFKAGGAAASGGEKKKSDAPAKKPAAPAAGTGPGK